MYHFVTSIVNRLDLDYSFKNSRNSPEKFNEKFPEKFNPEDVDENFREKLIKNALQKREIFRRQDMIPLDSSWWSSKEQIVFLRVLASVLDRKEPNSRETMLEVVSLCPGPWSVSSLETLQRYRHDDLRLVAACIELACRWSSKYHSQCLDFSMKVQATIASDKFAFMRWLPKSIRISLIAKILRSVEFLHFSTISD